VRAVRALYHARIPNVRGSCSYHNQRICQSEYALIETSGLTNLRRDDWPRTGLGAVRTGQARSFRSDGSEEEPSSDADDDFETDEGLTARDAEYERMAAAATAAGVPPRRPGCFNRSGRRARERAGAAAHPGGRRCPPGRRVLVRVFGALLRPRSDRSEF
jgi:hypothetical protein